MRQQREECRSSAEVEVLMLQLCGSLCGATIRLLGKKTNSVQQACIVICFLVAVCRFFVRTITVFRLREACFLFVVVWFGGTGASSALTCSSSALLAAVENRWSSAHQFVPAATVV